jgi:hypothetical protein
VDGFFRLVHELALERLLGRQVKCVEQVCLPILVHFGGVVEHLDTLLLLERQIFFDLLRYCKTSEHSRITLLIDLLIVVFVLRVSFLRNRKVTLPTKLGVRL